MIPFDNNIRDLIRYTIENQNKDAVSKCHRELGINFLNIVKYYFNDKKFSLIAMHGQTISHVNGIKTLQIGDPKYLFNYYKIPIIYDFRSKDIELGGNGAPLVPYLDWLLLRKTEIDTVTLNLGGIANLTYIPMNGNRLDVIGFDTGPGMSLIDEFVNKHWNIRFDVNGEIASKGVVDHKLLEILLNDHYINSDFPKSTSREVYGLSYIDNILCDCPNINKFNILRTLVLFTAESINMNVKLLLNKNDNFHLIISGGGVKNHLLIQDIKKIFNTSKVFTSEIFDINIDSKEALLMAVMGLLA